VEVFLASMSVLKLATSLAYRSLKPSIKFGLLYQVRADSGCREYLAHLVMVLDDQVQVVE